jgi:pyruvate/2-oxoglutarate dehydrogenase complex dihydrolipoamide dehydrogenase (E3) component
LPVDYDLVIVGNTHAAHLAALAAVQWPARVALVRPRSSTGFCAHLYPYALQQASVHQSSRSRDPNYAWHYAQAVVSHFAHRLAPVFLAAQGVDVINSNGEFGRKPQLAFHESRRSLIAQKYLLAMGGQPQIFNIPGLKETGYLTMASLSKVAKREKIPRRWAIVGTEAIGVELAQTLCRLGCRVTLLVESSQVLPEEDPEAVAIIQAQLEAAGVILVTQVVVTEVGTQEGAKYLVVNNQNIYVDEIFLATPERPIVESFGLQAAGVEYDENGVLVNDKLETSNSRILACGSVCGKVLGGYYGEHLAEYEAKLAVHNALSPKLHQTNYFKIPWVVFSEPQLARVGMTMGDAQRQFRKRLVLLQADYLENPKAMMAENNVGFLKIAVRPNGRIVGATVVGPDAAELMQILALAIRQRLSIEALRDFPGVSLTHTHLVVAAAQQWRRPARWLQLLDPLFQAQFELRQGLLNKIDRLTTMIGNLLPPRRSVKKKPGMASGSKS